MEEAAGSGTRATGTRCRDAIPGTPVLVRYADDLVAMCHRREQAEQVKARLAEWLAPRGLGFNEDKTRIVHLDEGFDFLGFNVRRYRNGKLLIKPSKAAVRRIRDRLRTEMRALRGANAAAVIATAQPDHAGLGGLLPDGGVQRGVHRAGQLRVDAHLQVGQCAATRTSRSTGSSTRYFGRFNKARQDRWVFGDRDSGAYLIKFSWTKIVRHQTGQGPGVTRRPDPDRLLGRPATPRAHRPLDRRPRCACCRRSTAAARSAVSLLLHADHEPQSPDEWEHWLTATRKAIRRHAITATGSVARRTITPSPHTRALPTPAPRPRHGSPALLTAREPSGLA